MLLPDFTRGYYQSGISFGIIALLLIIIASISGAVRNKVAKYWKLGHGLVYITFTLATIHGVMIGSEMNTKLFTYLVYVGALSLIIAYVYKMLFLSTKNSA